MLPDRARFPAALALLLLTASAAAARPGGPNEPAGPEPPAATGNDELGRPGFAPPDVFYPGFDYKTDKVPAPKKGGRVIVHLEALPKHMNYMLENSTYTRNMLYEVHEFLVARDWETWEHHTPLCKDAWQEDTVILKGGRSDDNGNIHYGKVTEDGDHYVVTPVSPGNPLKGELRVPKSDVQSVERETVFTFQLRDDVKWHDGHALDSGDVACSWKMYSNPHVACDWIRFKARDQFAHFEVVNEHTVRFFYKEQYFLAFDSFTGWILLPSHIYDLADPDNKDHNAEATPEEQGEYVNQHPNNNDFIGLGPYKVTKYDQTGVEAVKFKDFFDPKNGGHFDTIWWRHIASDDAAAVALTNGELDFSPRVKTEDYFGELTQRKEFTDKYYKGYFYVGYMGYIAWNMKRSLFEDRDVRLALSHCMNWEELLNTYYKGLGMRVGSTVYRFGPNYNEDLELVPYDLDTAEELLADAGWYDRDGDDIIDKDGNNFEFEFLISTGNKSSETMAQSFQASLAKVGIKMNIATREWATFLERIYARDFDCTSLAWSLPVESDPFQLWHGSQANKRSSNRVGLEDPETDRLIEAIQKEIDPAKRAEYFHQMQARIYELQPYTFGVNVPRKFAMSKKIRNFQTFAIVPGYSIRRWYFTEE